MLLQGCQHTYVSIQSNWTTGSTPKELYATYLKSILCMPRPRRWRTRSAKLYFMPEQGIFFRRHACARQKNECIKFTIICQWTCTFSACNLFGIMTTVTTAFWKKCWFGVLVGDWDHVDVTHSPQLETRLLRLAPGLLPVTCYVEWFLYQSELFWNVVWHYAW